MRALAAAEDEQRWRSFTFGRNFEECLAHRNPSDLAMAKIFCRLRKVNCRSRDEAGNHAIGKSGHDIRFERQRRDMFHDSREHGWAGGISSDADDDVGSELVEHAAGVPYGAG